MASRACKGDSLEIGGKALQVGVAQFPDERFLQVAHNTFHRTFILLDRVKTFAGHSNRCVIQRPLELIQRQEMTFQDFRSLQLLHSIREPHLTSPKASTIRPHALTPPHVLRYPRSQRPWPCAPTRCPRRATAWTPRGGGVTMRNQQRAQTG